MVAKLPPMPGRLPGFRSLVRIAMLALLAFAVVAGPALSFAAETHEAVGHPAADGCGHGHPQHDQDDRNDEADAGDGGRMLHLVTQLGICCGHACALLPATWPLAAQAVPAQPHARIETLAPGRAAENPLRPPIAA